MNDVTVELLGLLAPLLNDDITSETDLDPSARSAAVEPAMLQQALMNLCTNARDAMPDGGALTIETRAIHLTEAVDKARPGDYVRLAVRDTGCEIPDDLRDRILEPFFSTKEPSKGTGLGLSMVYTILQQHHGYLEIESEVNRGTTIAMHFPVVPQPADSSDDTLPQLLDHLSDFSAVQPFCEVSQP